MIYFPPIRGGNITDFAPQAKIFGLFPPHYGGEQQKTSYFAKIFRLRRANEPHTDRSRFSVMWYTEIPGRDSRLGRAPKKNRLRSRWNRLRIGMPSNLRSLNMKPASDKHSEVVKTWFLQSRGFSHEIRAEIPYSGFSHNVFLY